IDSALGQPRTGGNRIDGGPPEAEPPERFIGRIHDPPSNVLGSLSHLPPRFISILVSSFTVSRTLAKLSIMAHSGAVALAGDACHALNLPYLPVDHSPTHRAEAEATGGGKDRHHHRLAAHPHRSFHRGGHRRAQLSGALHRQDDALPGP